MTGAICRVVTPKDKIFKPWPIHCLVLQDKGILFLFERLSKCKRKMKCYLPSVQIISIQLCNYRIAKMKSWTL